jgi:hypothetical protein
MRAEPAPPEPSVDRTTASARRTAETKRFYRSSPAGSWQP